MGFTIFNKNKKNWNQLLTHFKYFNHYHLFEWGEYSEYSKWKITRILEYDINNKFISMTQILSKKKIFFNILWIPGGPVSNSNKWPETLPKFIRKNFGFFSYTRINSSEDKKFFDTNFLQKMKNHWSKPLYKMTSEKRMEFNIGLSEKSILQKFSKNWRHNLKRSYRDQNKVKINPNPNHEEIYKYSP